MLPPITPPLGTPFIGIITIPITLYGYGNGDNRNCGVATFDKSGTGATSILQAVFWVSPKRQLRSAKAKSSCASYASCAAARGAAVGALGSQPVVMTYRTPGTQGSLPIVVSTWAKIPFMCG
jgi:hypothetical protein